MSFRQKRLQLVFAFELLPAGGFGGRHTPQGSCIMLVACLFFSYSFKIVAELSSVVYTRWRFCEHGVSAGALAVAGCKEVRQPRRRLNMERGGKGGLGGKGGFFFPWV